MPPVPRTLARMARVTSPAAVAYALNPAQATRPHLGQTLSVGSPPNAGETREEQAGSVRGALAVGQTRAICGLRAPWRNVGCIIDPGNAAGAGLVFFFRVEVYGVNGSTPQTAVLAAVGPQAFIGFPIGARAELVVLNGTAAPIVGLRGSIWGMNDG